MLIFISIAIAAFIIVAGSFLFGHDVDHDAGHDLGHDVGGGAGEATISIFSVKVLGTLLMGFGAAGAIARYYGMGYPAASGVGVGFGVVLGGIMWGFLELIASQQASSISSVANVVNQIGNVTVSIGENEVGEIGVTYGSRYMNYPARSRDGKPIAKGRQVRIVDVGGVVTVEEVRRPEA